MVTWQSISARQGRNDLPYLLARAVLVDHTLTSPKQIAMGIADAWTMAEWPARALEPNIWAYLWAEAEWAAGLTYLDDDGKLRDAAKLPDTATLYRGAAEGYEHGMAWTSEFERAHWFATRLGPLAGGGPCKIWAVDADREDVMARFDRRNEAEWVLDPDGFWEPAEVTPEHWKSLLASETEVR